MTAPDQGATLNTRQNSYTTTADSTTTRLVHRLFFFVVDGLRGLGLEVRGPRCCAELLEPYGQRVADGGVQA